MVCGDRVIQLLHSPFRKASTLNFLHKVCGFFDRVVMDFEQSRQRTAGVWARSTLPKTLEIPTGSIWNFPAVAVEEEARLRCLRKTRNHVWRRVWWGCPLKEEWRCRQQQSQLAALLSIVSETNREELKMLQWLEWNSTCSFSTQKLVWINGSMNKLGTDY